MKGEITMVLYTRKISKRKKVSFVAMLVILSIIMIYLFYSDIYFMMKNDNNSNAGLCFFYNILNPNMFFWITVYLLLLPSNILQDGFINECMNKFKYLIIERIGFKKYYYHNLLHNFLNSFFMICIIYIYMLIFIHICLAPISFSYSEYVASTNMIINVFSKNTFLNLVTYIFLSSIGFSIFSTLIFSLKNHFKNKYLFRLSSLVLGIVLMVLPIIIGSILYNLINIDLILYFFSALSLFSLFVPGTQVFGNYLYIDNTLITFVFAVSLYLLIIAIIIFVERKREYAYES